MLPAIMIAGAMITTPALAQTPASADTVLATVNGTAITEADLASMYEALPQQYRQMPLTMLRPQLLDQVIESELMMQAGDKSGLEKDPEVAAQLANLKRQVIAQAYVANIVNGAITNEALEAEYQALLVDLPPQDEVAASHILVETEEAAIAIIEELKGGADFAELAKAKSTGPSGPNGGDLGRFQHGQMVRPFADAAFSMEKGAFSETPVQTQFGWHVIQVHDKFEGEPPRQIDVLDELEARVSRKAIAELREKLRAEADIQIMDAQ
jgi:peptidyl-prolyl cis-trans isomerase C